MKKVEQIELLEKIIKSLRQNPMQFSGYINVIQKQAGVSIQAPTNISAQTTISANFAPQNSYIDINSLNKSVQENIESQIKNKMEKVSSKLEDIIKELKKPKQDQNKISEILTSVKPFIPSILHIIISTIIGLT